MRWGIRAGRLAALVAVGVSLPAGEASAAHSSPGTTGYDISYPQCGGAYPSGQAFGVVGVNGGLANDANGCFSSELSWALQSHGLTSPPQPPASLYINTADPGPGVADWPASGSSTAYGICGGGWTPACAYVYGEQRAGYSYGLVNSADPSVASSAPWWLDIETANSWATSGTPAYSAADLNIATIRGLIDGLKSDGANGPIGIYSTANQWQSITGLTSTSTTNPWYPYFSNSPNWVAGARTLRQARANCSASFTGGHVGLAQYPSGGFDADYACPQTG